MTKKIPLIPPLSIDRKIVIDVRTKSNIFNKFFAEQCTPLKNDSILPSSQEFLTREKLCSLEFSNDEILKSIRSLNVHKAHGHDDISIRTIKIYDKSLLEVLIILFQNSVKLPHYPDVWKKYNIMPVHRKNDKQLIQNYREIFLLLIFCKMFEKVVFNRIDNFLFNERLRLFDSCINQLIAITYEIF